VWFNRRHRRSGHLFEGRFQGAFGRIRRAWRRTEPLSAFQSCAHKQARAVQEEKGGRAGGMGRTVETVKERLKALSSYRWSSYPSYLRGKGPPWLHRAALLSRFGRGARARALYRRYVEEAIRSSHEESPLEKVKAGFVLGGEEFLQEIRTRIRGDAKEQPRLREITGPCNSRTFSRSSASTRARSGKSTPTAAETGAETWCSCSQGEIPC
jgi:hypothetical protein